MRYSWVFGEMTKGFEWYDRDEIRTVQTKKRGGEKYLKLLSVMALFLFLSYFAGAVITADSESYIEKTNGEYADAVPAMSYGMPDTYDDVAEREKEARISELAAAYIEEYMYANYGGDCVE